MVQITLGWYQRINLWLRVGGIQAPNMQAASILYRILEKIRPSDKEQMETEMRTQGDMCQWKLPTENYGTCNVELENAEAEAFIDAIEKLPQPVQVRDVGWLLDVIKQLKSQEAPKPVEGELVPCSK